MYINAREPEGLVSLKGLSYYTLQHLTLVMIRGKYTLVMMGGGHKVPPPLFLFVKTIEKVIRLCTVLKFFFLIDSFKDKAIFHVILEIDR